MGFFDTLFGSAPSTEIKQQSTFTKAQKSAEQELLELIQGSGNPENQQSFQGDLVAPVSDLEGISLTGLEQRSQQLATGGDPVYQESGKALIDILTKGPTDISDFIENSVKNPLMEAFNEDIRPAVSSRFADQFFGSDRKEADARSIEDLINTFADVTARTSLEARNQDTNAILQALNLAPGVASGQTNELMKLLQSGSVPREVQTAQNLGEFERFSELNKRRLSFGELINQFLGKQGVENIAIEDPGSAGLLSGVITGAATAFGGAAGGKLATLLL